MNSLSMKLHECLALSTRGSFPEFIINIIIADDAIRTHMESKKRKVVVAPSGSAPPKYHMVYHPHPTYQPQQQQWASRPH
jgi:hypothetical protein